MKEGDFLEMVIGLQEEKKIMSNRILHRYHEGERYFLLAKITVPERMFTVFFRQAGMFKGWF